MSFNGTFFYLYDEDKKQWDAFPLKYMFKESYKGAMEVQDLDSTVNANGVLERTTLDHTRYTIEFATPPMWNNDMNKLSKFFNDHYVNKKQRKVKVRFYKNETDSYVDSYTLDGKTHDCYFYVATPSFSVNRVDGDKILYNSMTYNLIQY